MNSNLDALTEVQNRVESLNRIIKERWGTDEHVAWEVISVTRSAAWIKVITGHEQVMEVAAIFAAQADSWTYVYPLEFCFQGKHLRTTVTLREREEGDTQ